MQQRRIRIGLLLSFVPKVLLQIIIIINLISKKRSSLRFIRQTDFIPLHLIQIWLKDSRCTLRKADGAIKQQGQLFAKFPEMRSEKVATIKSTEKRAARFDSARCNHSEEQWEIRASFHRARPHDGICGAAGFARWRRQDCEKKKAIARRRRAPCQNRLSAWINVLVRRVRYGVGVIVSPREEEDAPRRDAMQKFLSHRRGCRRVHLRSLFA